LLIYLGEECRMRWNLPFDAESAGLGCAQSVKDEAKGTHPMDPSPPPPAKVIACFHSDSAVEKYTTAEFKVGIDRALRTDVFPMCGERIAEIEELSCHVRIDVPPSRSYP
jgi:hypothetical protein